MSHTITIKQQKVTSVILLAGLTLAFSYYPLQAMEQSTPSSSSGFSLTTLFPVRLTSLLSRRPQVSLESLPAIEQKPFSHPLFTNKPLVQEGEMRYIELSCKDANDSIQTLTISLPKNSCAILDAISNPSEVEQPTIACKDSTELYCLANMLTIAGQLVESSAKSATSEDAKKEYSVLTNYYINNWSTLLPEEMRYLLTVRQKHGIKELDIIIARALAYFLNNKHNLRLLATTSFLWEAIRGFIAHQNANNEFCTCLQELYKTSFIKLILQELSASESDRAAVNTESLQPQYIKNPVYPHITVTVGHTFVKVKNTKTGLTITQFETTAPVKCTLWHPNGKYLLLVTTDGIAWLWNVETEKLLWSIKNINLMRNADRYLTPNDAVYTPYVPVSFSPDGKLVAALLFEKSAFIAIIDITSGKQIATISLPPSCTDTYVNFTKDGLRITSGFYVYNQKSYTCQSRAIFNTVLTTKQMLYCLSIEALQELKPEEIQALPLVKTNWFKDVHISLPEEVKIKLARFYTSILQQVIPLI